MKKGIRIILIIASILFALGLILLIAGVLSGGRFKNISLTTGKEFEYEEINEDYSKDTIDNLDLEVARGKVYIEEGDSFSIQGSKVIKGTIETGVKDNTLYIKDKNNGWSFLEYIGLYLEPEDTIITVTIPKGFVVKETELNVMAGALYMESFTTDQLDLEVSAGKVSMDKVTVNEDTSISLGAGSVSGDALNAHNLKVDIAAGSCSLKGTFKGALDLMCSAGSMNIETTMTEKEYSYDIERNAGSVQINGKSYKNNDNSSKTANNSIKVVCNAGSINIDTK